MTGQACICGAGLAPGQRYCLACGSATPLARELRGALWTHPQRPAPNLPAPATGRYAFATSSQSLRAATVAFALVLGVSAWAGARLTVPPPATAQAYLAAPNPAPPPAVPVPPTVSGGDPDVGDEASTAASGGETPAGPEPGPADAAPVDDAPSDAGDGGTDSTADPHDQAGDDEAPSATTPALAQVIVVAVPPLAPEAFTDRGGAAPYLAGTLSEHGTLLSGFHGATPSALASNIALLSGQAPNDATRASCPSFAPVMPGTIGEDEQAEGLGCEYPADVFTTGDLLGSLDRTWAIYSGAGAESCTAPAPGAPLPPGRPAPLAFASVAAADCPSRLRPLDRLASDLKRKDAPALAYVELAGESPAEIDTALRQLMPELLTDRLLPKASAILIVPAHAPQIGGADDRTPADPTRAWTPAGGGGGRTSALVLSPLVAAGAVDDTPIDHYDVGRTLALALGVRPLGFTAHDDVAGIPAAAWARWKPAA